MTFNETVVRGSGAITYDVTKGNLTSYANGTIESVAINNESVTITLPESVVFDENEAVSYVFLDFAEGAFADAGGNVSAALVGGVDEELKPLQLLIGSIPLHKKVILQVHSDSCSINMIFKHNNPEVHLWDSILSFH